MYLNLEFVNLYFTYLSFTKKNWVPECSCNSLNLKLLNDFCIFFSWKKWHDINCFRILGNLQDGKKLFRSFLYFYSWVISTKKVFHKKRKCMTSWHSSNRYYVENLKVWVILFVGNTIIPIVEPLSEFWNNVDSLSVYSIDSVSVIVWHM